MFSINSLFKRTFFLIVTTLVVVVSFFLTLFVESQNNTLIDVMYSKANTVAKSIALVSSDAMITNDYTFLVEHNQRVLDDNEEIQYIIITKKGDASLSILSTDDGWKMLEKLPENLQNMNTDKRQSAIIQSNMSYEKDIYHFSYPVSFSTIDWGWVLVGYSVKTYDAQMETIYRNSFLMLLATLAASFLFSFFLARWIVQPVLTLNKAAKQVADGDLNIEVKINSQDELSELANSFNHMVNTIKMSNQRLHSYNEELEIRVNERTNELSQLNEELDQRVKDEVHKRAQQEQLLIEQSRFAAMGEMIGNIAHQWRQPLNALGLLLQNLEYTYEMGLLDEAQIQRSVEKGNRLTNSMSQTIDDFRNFFKPNKEVSTFSIAQSIENTMGILRSSLENNMILIHEEIDETVSIEGFSSEFSQVILNIINNAKDALVENKEEGREVFIRVFKDADYAKVEIEDNAGGIAGDGLKKIFDPYFTTKDEGKGTGIGLYMSKTIIENNMHGSLKVKNTQKGAIFTIKIRLKNA